MDRKDRMDAFGIVSLSLFSGVLAVNQVVIKVTNAGLQPVFSAGLRSLGAVIILGLVFRILGRRMEFPRAAWPGLALMCFAFTVEFILLFLALDYTTAGRSALMLYSMPIWMAVGAHFILPDDRLTPMRGLGLLLAIAGVAWALLDRSPGEGASLLGDALALMAAILWAVIGLAARGTHARDARPEAQLMVQLIVSAIVLIGVSFLFGPLVRDPTILTLWGMGFQILIIASMGFLFWLWVLTIYPPSSVASFSFLSPVFGVFFGWLLLGEAVGPEIFGSLVLVCLGLVLINRRT